MTDYAIQARQEIIEILLAVLISIIVLWRSKDVRDLVKIAFLNPNGSSQKGLSDHPRVRSVDDILPSRTSAGNSPVIQKAEPKDKEREQTGSPQIRE